MKKRLGALMLSVVICLGAFLGLSACGSKKSSNKLVINYQSGERVLDGESDEDVRKAIEEKFKNDTGKDLTLEVNSYTEAAFNQQVSTWFSSDVEQVDAVRNYVVFGGSNLVNYAKTPDTVLCMEDVVKDSVYLNKIKENDPNHIVERAGYMNVDGEMMYNVLNDSNNEKGWGWAVNKTFWKEAFDAGKTTLNPEDYDAYNPSYKNLKISEFESVMTAIKQVQNDKDNKMKYPVYAYGWDMERLFAPLFDVTTLSTVEIERNGGKYYTLRQFADGYGDYLDWLAHLVNENIYESANTSTTDSVRTDYFLSGLSAVYMSYPDIDELIRICRNFNTVNNEKNWECMICGPLAKEDGTVPGFSKREKTFDGIISPWHSQNQQLLLDFINWTYSSKENYELCKYGREGIDWKASEVEIDGVKYDGWKYPEGKEEAYLAKPPYNGKYLLLENVNISDRVSLIGTEKEITYLIRSKYADESGHGFKYYDNNKWIEGVYVAEVPYELTSGEAAVISGFAKGPQAQAWSGKWPTKFATYKEFYNAWIENSFSKETSKNYLDWYSDQVKFSIDFFNNKW